MDELFLVDASSFLYKNYYALPKLSTSKGEEVGALYGFTRLIVKILKKTNYLAVCYDSRKNIRKDLDLNYKSNRKKIDDELIKQIDISKDVLKGMGIRYFEFEGYEADDVIASVVKSFKDNFGRIIIVTSDKDLMQLIDDKVFVWDGKSESYTGFNDVVAKYGVSPSLLRDFLVLCGDISDNVKGIEGIGPKTASKILSKYGSLENIISGCNYDKDDLKYVKKIIDNKDLIERLYALISLRDSIKVEVLKEDLKFEINSDKAYEILSRLEFRNIISELGISKTENIDFKKISANEFISLNPFYISIFNDNVFFENYITDFESVKSLLFDLSVKKYLYNSKELFTRIQNCEVFNYDDIMIAYHLTWGASRKPDPYRIIEEMFLVKSDCPLCYFKKVMVELDKKIDEFNMRDLYENEKELSKVLYVMEKKGIKIDVDFLRKLGMEYKNKSEEIQKKFSEIAQVNINLNSPKQLSDFLFKKLNIKIESEYESIFKTRTGGYSTSEDVLKMIMPYNPEVISLILKYREYTKLSSFVDNLISEIRDLRIHTHFDQVATSTGRLSSYSPNLQNVPVKDEQAIRIRNAFVADEGYVFVSFDYSQIDLRVIAELSADEQLVKAFKENLDIHRITASSIFDVDYDKVDDKMRRIAKTVNFGIIYGLSSVGLAVELSIDRATASQYIEKYFKKYSGVKQWIDKTLEFARKNGYVVNFCGRRRFIPDINSKNRVLRNASERMAINMPVQSASSDIIKKAMVEIYRKFKNNDDIFMLLQIHDDLLFEIKEDKTDEYIKEIKDIMENVFKFKVPLVVNVKKGKKWGELK